MRCFKAAEATNEMSRGKRGEGGESNVYKESRVREK